MNKIVPERAFYSNRAGKIEAQTLVFIATIVLVGIAAFGLGRLSATPILSGNVIIHEPGEPGTK